MDRQITYKWRWLAGGLVSVFLVLFVFVVLPYASVVYEKAVLLGAQQEQISFMSNWQQRLARLEDRQQSLNEGMKAMVINLAEQEEFSKVVETFFSHSQQSGVTIVQIQPVTEDQNPPYMTRRLRLELQGGYHGIARFINKLEQGNYLVTTESVSLRAGAGTGEQLSGELELQVTLLGGTP
ncbi:type 4a pilus biogenesis protein PilO [Gracilimonas sp.]|uniref:type 4a pilus biogenesis protein PilO n=1 Tax=Gracilimonas sp. TaxID=1974203 RepID=UPI003BA99BE3